MEFAQVIVTRRMVLPGKYYETYSWLGKKSSKVVIPEYIDLNKLPWPMKIIEFDYVRDGSICLRKDVYFWWITYLFDRISIVFQWVNVRIIMTAHVWGIINIKQGEIPTWKQLFQKGKQ
jgi:hypothetical protein